jgi:ribose 1,5-bisphosphokinase
LPDVRGNLFGAHDCFMTARYALYFAPDAASAWHAFGDTALTGEARRYGFHATLKAPFRLAPGARLERLLAELDAWCGTLARFPLPVLQVRRLDDFYALVPAECDARIDAVADACVSRFDGFRAPLTDAELARRLARPLSVRQRELLHRWGYPHVFDEFRFHLSLTGVLPGGRAPAFPALPPERLAFDAISVFEEPEPGAPFRRIHRAPFRPAGRLVYVVGPSGAGKDSVLDWARRELGATEAVVFARRTITRAPDPGGEDHVAVTPGAFEELRAGGAFAMAWEANGHRYGIDAGIRRLLEEGRTVVVNGSRAYAAQALRDFPDMEVVLVTAPEPLLRERLRSRGREGPAAIAQRMARSTRHALPAGLAAAELVNDGDLGAAGRRLASLLLSP